MKDTALELLEVDYYNQVRRLHLDNTRLRGLEGGVHRFAALKKLILSNNEVFEEISNPAMPLLKEVTLENNGRLGRILLQGNMLESFSGISAPVELIEISDNPKLTTF